MPPELQAAEILNEGVRVDDIDARIVALVEEDGRRSNRDIARTLGISEKQAGTRVRRLLEQDVMRIVTVVDVFAAGFEFMLAVGIEVDGRAASDVAVDLAAFPEVLSVFLMSGPFDIEIVVVAQSHAWLAGFVKEQLLRIRGIRSLAPSLRLEVLKYQSGTGPLGGLPRTTVSFPTQSPLDEMDRGIIRELWSDSRATNQEIAVKLATSESTVRARVGDLLRRNAMRITAISNLRIGRPGVFAFIWIDAETPHHAAVAAALRQVAAVSFAVSLLGRHDFLAVAVVESATDLADLVHEQIARIRGVRSARPSQALRFVKYDHRWTVVKPLAD